MKNCVLQVRVTPEEKNQILNTCAASGMNPSQYFRASLLDKPVYQNGSAQIIMAHVCKIYGHLSKEGSEETKAIMEELNGICRALSC